MCGDCIKDKQNPPLFSDANCLDPGRVPTHLPALSEIEEMLIGRVHFHEYQYTGHVVCFAQNTPEVWRQLPLLPQELDIVILKPTAAEIDHQLHRRFRQVYNTPLCCWCLA